MFVEINVLLLKDIDIDINVLLLKFVKYGLRRGIQCISINKVFTLKYNVFNCMEMYNINDFYIF